MVALKSKHFPYKVFNLYRFYPLSVNMKTRSNPRVWKTHPYATAVIWNSGPRSILSGNWPSRLSNSSLLCRIFYWSSVHAISVELGSYSVTRVSNCRFLRCDYQFVDWFFSWLFKLCIGLLQMRLIEFMLPLYSKQFICEFVLGRKILASGGILQNFVDQDFCIVSMK